MGALATARYLTADMLITGTHTCVFLLTLQEGEEGPAFGLSYTALNQCAARLRMPLEAALQNRWRYPREGAWLKPLCTGERVDLRRVDRMSITVLRKSDQQVHWCLTTVTATIVEPPLLADPLLPRGPLLDDLGQSTIHDWPAKSTSTSEVTERLRAQLAVAPERRAPDDFSRWGGWKGRRAEATGYFRTHHDGRRWWLVDPDGHVFWSAGMDCVQVDVESSYAGLETALSWMPARGGPYEAIYALGAEGPEINYLAANCIRAFGPEAWYGRWAEIALAELRGWGFNTVANWSDWQVASAAGFSYVRPMELSYARTPLIYRDFPDVFHPQFAADAAAFAAQLGDTADDPALIGYFLMNEPTWGFAQETPAAGMLFTTTACASRTAMAAFLRNRHGDDAGLSAAWGMSVTLAAVAEGVWTALPSEPARADLAAFSSVMVDRLFRGLSDACRAVDPHHLNLGARYHTVPPAWAVEGMRCFDVFSVNGYDQRVRTAALASLSQTLDRPIMIGEWHFGALDVGLPASGIAHVRDQQTRGQAYRVYLEDAAAQPWCVGAHYFTLYDESALGRFDGENWNTGFLDVCNRPYEPLVSAARATHEQLYSVAQGDAQPFNEEPEYLPRLFF